MALLPQFQSDDKDFQLMQNKWASLLNPIISNPSNNTSALKNISLIAGVNVINHKLGKKLTGWRLVRKRAAADIYDNQDDNQYPELTLILVTDADVSVDLEIY